MHKPIADMWTAALRSGKYKQGHEHLKHAGAFCCLGVLCELHRKHAGGRWTRLGFYCTEDDGDSQFPPINVQTWAGLQHQDPEVRVGDATEQLTYLNDKRGATFPEIADIIEAQWEKL